jgi:hypothetical protein
MSVGLPDILRPPLRALAAGVVARAQDAYRARVRLVPEPSNAERAGLSAGDQWPQISEALDRVLGHDPDLLDRALVALSNVRPPGRVPLPATPAPRGHAHADPQSASA